MEPKGFFVSNYGWVVLIVSSIIFVVWVWFIWPGLKFRPDEGWGDWWLNIAQMLGLVFVLTVWGILLVFLLGWF